MSEFCEWCHIGVPVNEFGNHIIRQFYGLGDAAIRCPEFVSAPAGGEAKP